MSDDPSVTGQAEGDHHGPGQPEANRDHHGPGPEEAARHHADSQLVRPVMRPRWARRARRIALASVISVAVVAGGLAASGYAIVNHLANNVHRIPNVFAGLDAATRPVMPDATRRSMTILLTGSNTLPANRGGTGIDRSSKAPEDPSGLIALVHIDASRRDGAIVSIPPTAVVRVPGHGRRELEDALPLGGPALLIRSVERLTDVRIDHYSVVDFNGLVRALKPLGGVNVDVPDLTSSNGVVFHPGINHLNGATALDYVRQTSLTEDQRVLRQQALLRAVLDKIAAEHLLSHPTAGFRILDAFTKALSVDSDFSNSQLESLALHLHLLGGRDATFVSAPVRRMFVFEGRGAVQLNQFVSRKLWRAIRHDAVRQFARRYPFTVTPRAPQ